MRPVLFALGLIVFAQGAWASDYIPPAGPEWATHTPAAEGFDAAKLKAAIDFAVANETKFPPELAKVADVRDLRIAVPIEFGKEPFSSPIGPLQPRAPANGIILRHGYIVAEWGDTHAVDMTFSISKTFLSHLAGIAVAKGLIKSVDDRVIDDVQPGPDFATPHNLPITWDEMLRQTSGWEGTMWGKPWWADRPGKDPWTELAGGAPEPGKSWKYSDVRANAFALALTYVWRRPLPDVLREYVMTPIGASDSWHWEGYDNSWITLDGQRIHVVPGGGHWGGGMFISARDLARLGLLGLWRGQWGEKRILSEEWVKRATTPTDVEPGYGYMNWFLNTGRQRFPAAREDAVAYIGNGTNMVYIDYQHDVVAVVRWIDNSKLADFVALLQASVKDDSH